MGSDDPRAAARVEEMLEIQRHRGPDGSGMLCDSGMVIGHRRLAILGLGDAGRQPMTSRDGRWSLVFNGEIFNYRELAWRNWQANFAAEPIRKFCSKGLRLGASRRRSARAAGMFALALWDHREKELTLARDRLGEKPLVYFYDGRILAFASEMKALRGFHGGVMEPAAVDAYLALGYVPAPLAIFRGMPQIGGGAVVAIQDRGRAAAGALVGRGVRRGSRRGSARRRCANGWARRSGSGCGRMFRWRLA